MRRYSSSRAALAGVEINFITFSAPVMSMIHSPGYGAASTYFIPTQICRVFFIEHDLVDLSDPLPDRREKNKWPSNPARLVCKRALHLFLKTVYQGFHNIYFSGFGLFEGFSKARDYLLLLLRQLPS